LALAQAGLGRRESGLARIDGLLERFRSVSIIASA